jgi:hypothetical protein
MQKLLAALAVIVLAPAPGQNPAPEKTAVMAVVHRFADGFNKGDTKTALAACAEQTSIIDEFPPHEWHGAGACAQWMNDYDANARENGITDGVVTLRAPKHVDITGDRAYVVVPAAYAFKQKGKAVREVGSLLTIALQKGPAGWRITAWSWSKN